MTNSNDGMSVLAAETRRPAYQSPRLSMLGDIGSLTETGSMIGMEDGLENMSCNGAVAPINMTFNMC